MRRSDDDHPRGQDLGPDPTVRRLSPREHEVALLLARGLKDAAIAEHLGVSTPTIGNYVRHILRRLKLDSRAELAAWVTARLVPDDPAGRLRRIGDRPEDVPSELSRRRET
jgi:DNA-binding NarL/FixJ family response regulator